MLRTKNKMKHSMRKFVSIEIRQLRLMQSHIIRQMKLIEIHAPVHSLSENEGQKNTKNVHNFECNHHIGRSYRILISMDASSEINVVFRFVCLFI